MQRTLLSASTILVLVVSSAWNHKHLNMPRLKRQAIPSDHIQIHSFDSNVTVNASAVSVVSGESRIELVERFLNGRIWSESSLLEFQPHGYSEKISGNDNVSTLFNMPGADLSTKSNQIQMSLTSNRSEDGHSLMEMRTDSDVDLVLIEKKAHVEALQAKRAQIRLLTWQVSLEPRLILTSNISQELERQLYITSTTNNYNLVIVLDGGNVTVHYGNVVVEIASDYRSFRLVSPSHTVYLKTVRSPFDVFITGHQMSIRCVDENTAVHTRLNSSDINIDVQQYSKAVIERNDGEMRIGGSQQTSEDSLELTSMQLAMLLESADSKAVHAAANNSQLRMHTNSTKMTSTSAHHVVDVLGGAASVDVSTGNVSILVTTNADGMAFPTALTLLTPPDDLFASVGPQHAEKASESANVEKVPMTSILPIQSSATTTQTMTTPGEPSGDGLEPSNPNPSLSTATSPTMTTTTSFRQSQTSSSEIETYTTIAQPMMTDSSISAGGSAATGKDIHEDVLLPAVIIIPTSEQEKQTQPTTRGDNGATRRPSDQNIDDTGTSDSISDIHKPSISKHHSNQEGSIPSATGNDEPTSSPISSQVAVTSRQDRDEEFTGVYNGSSGGTNLSTAQHNHPAETVESNNAQTITTAKPAPSEDSSQTRPTATPKSTNNGCHGVKQEVISNKSVPISAESVDEYTRVLPAATTRSSLGIRTTTDVFVFGQFGEQETSATNDSLGSSTKIATNFSNGLEESPASPSSSSSMPSTSRILNVLEVTKNPNVAKVGFERVAEAGTVVYDGKNECTTRRCKGGSQAASHEANATDVATATSIITATDDATATSISVTASTIDDNILELDLRVPQAVNSDGARFRDDVSLALNGIVEKVLKRGKRDAIDSSDSPVRITETTRNNEQVSVHFIVDNRESVPIENLSKSLTYLVRNGPSWTLPYPVMGDIRRSATAHRNTDGIIYGFIAVTVLIIVLLISAVVFRRIIIHCIRFERISPYLRTNRVVDSMAQDKMSSISTSYHS